MFCRAGRVVFWLLQGQRDGGAEEAEGLALGGGGLGEHRDGDLGSGEPDLVAGQGGQVLQQAAEAAVGPPGRVALAGRFGLGGRGAAGRGDRVFLRGRVLVGEGERRLGLAQVPGEVAGEHADQHVGADAFFQPVEHGPQVQVVGLDVAEVPLDVLEVLVGGDDRGRARGRGCAARRTRPGRLRRRSCPVGAATARLSSVMVTAKCLPVLYLLITLPTSTPMGPAPVSLPAWTRARRGASSFSVAASRSSRTRARSAARTGLRQATSRSPGSPAR